MRRALTTFALVAMAACSPTLVEPTISANGHPAYKINCIDPLRDPNADDTPKAHDGECVEIEARKYCPNGFDVVGRATHQGGYIDTMPGLGLITRQVGLVVCR